MQAIITNFEFKCYRQLLRILYTELKSNEEVKNCIELEVGKTVNLIEVVRKRMLKWYGHVVRKSGNSLVKSILEGMVDGKRSRVRPENSWVTTITQRAWIKVVELLKRLKTEMHGKMLWSKGSCAPTT